MLRCLPGLILSVQLLMTQLLAAHCHADDSHASCGLTPHIHLRSLFGAAVHDADSADADLGTEGNGRESPDPRDPHDHDSDAHYLPDGWYAERPALRLVGGTLDLTLELPVFLDVGRRLTLASSASGVPPDPEPSTLPVYLRTLRLRF